MTQLWCSEAGMAVGVDMIEAEVGRDRLGFTITASGEHEVCITPDEGAISARVVHNAVYVNVDPAPDVGLTPEAAVELPALTSDEVEVMRARLGCDARDCLNCLDEWRRDARMLLAAYDRLVAWAKQLREAGGVGLFIALELERRLAGTDVTP